MFKNILMLFVFGVLIFGVSTLSFAMMCGSHSQNQDRAQAGHKEHMDTQVGAVVQQVPKEAVSVGNKVCPISGEKIDEKMKTTYEYEGKVYNFCCEMCIEDFKKDPQKYIKKIEEELEAEPKESGEPMQGHEGHQPEGSGLPSDRQSHQHSR